MARNYHLEPGYITVPQANEIVLTMLRIANRQEKKHYNRILAGAKKGEFGGKKHGSRMYQVREADIREYGIACLQEEQVQLFQIEIAQDTNKLDRDRQLPQIDQSTEINIQLYLHYLKHHSIITEEAFKDGERNLLMRIKLRDLNLAR